MWKHIKRKTNLIPCLYYFAGMSLFCFYILGYSILIGPETQESSVRFFGCYSDWNGSKRGHIYKFLRSQGFVSSYDTAHQYTDADAHKVNYLFLGVLITSQVVNFFVVNFLHPILYFHAVG